MCFPEGHGNLMVVSRTQTFEIRCEIDSVEGSLRGVLRNERGISRPFSGWTEFATALMALARDARHETETKKIEEEQTS